MLILVLVFRVRVHRRPQQSKILSKIEALIKCYLQSTLPSPAPPVPRRQRPTFPVISVVRGLLEGGVDCVFGMFSWSVWCFHFLSLSETCKFLHPSCMKNGNAFALHVFMQLGYTHYEIQEFLHEHVQLGSVHGTCTELARSLHANL